jgi:cobalt-zinc-cadmium efflux system membrane fusion protein
MITLVKTIFFSAIIALTFYSCENMEEEKKEKHHGEHSNTIILSIESINQINLKTELVKNQSFSGYLSVPAKVLTNQNNEAQIGSLIQGRVKNVLVQVGDYVKVGDILMTIEGLEVGEIKANYLIAKANMDYKKANLERHQKLFNEKIVSQKSLLECKAEYEKALAEFNAEDKKIHSIGLRDEDVTEAKIGDEHISGTLPIKSSISGIVVERNVVIGQFVETTTNAFKVINLNSIWIDGQIYEQDIEKINQETKTHFTTSAFQNEIFTGKIKYIGQTVNEQTRTITVRGEFPNVKNKLKPQMYGELKIPLNTKSNAILIPDESVVTESEKSYVFVQINDTSFEKRNIIVGGLYNNLFEVKKGLREGEKVVSKGVFYLKSELKKDELEGDEH